MLNKFVDGKEIRLSPSEEVAFYAANVEESDEADKTAYIAERLAEYPSFFDFIDGIVKEDQNQIDSFIAACRKVKEKYPKEEDK